MFLMLYCFDFVILTRYFSVGLDEMQNPMYHHAIFFIVC